MTALEKLQKKNSQKKFICVGLDTDIEKIPEHLKSNTDPTLEFNREIINATKDFAAAYKFNFAFYEKDGTHGFQTLFDSIKLVPDDILIIGDAKRGDIGNTSKMYAKSVFEYFKCDAITINPYMGKDSVLPFLDFPDKLNFILALTSNPGANDFEKLNLSDGSFLYQRIIETVKSWNTKKNCGIVFGATKSEELKENFNRLDSLPLLLPGIGAQGGSLEDIIPILKNRSPLNFLINVSRGIIYKSTGMDFALAANDEILNYNNRIIELFN
jgi:orotidine-5'-phosphate decarboxylase